MKDATIAADAPDSDVRPSWHRVLAAFALVVILLLGASLRLRAALETETSPALQGDSVDYVSAAYNIRQFDVFSHENLWAKNVQSAPKPRAFINPGYPAMLALLMPGSPDRDFLRRALLTQALLGVLVVGASFLFAVQLLPKPAALALAALIAVNPQLISLGTTLLTETLFSLLVVASLCALARACLRGGVGWYLVTGVLIGLSVLVRPTLEFLPLMLVPALAWFIPRSRWKPCLALLFGMLLAFGPWIVRNELAIGAASDPTLMTSTLRDGSYPDFMYRGLPQSMGYPYKFDPDATTIHTPGQAIARIRSNLESDPAGTLRWYLLSKPVRFFDWSFIEGSGSIFINTVKRSPYLEGQPDFVLSYEAMYFLHWPLIALAWAGIALALVAAARGGRSREAAVMGVLAVVMLFVIGLHTIGFPLGRYSVPFRPLTYLLALYALTTAIRWVRTRSP
ncbi:MAG TPA: glycosyltransferase family 39 protein [Xanthomonadaceae bacterium]|jgi:4-amino-4-deoxy-L-arabinose transferase-like glycosyltransferase